MNNQPDAHPIPNSTIQRSARTGLPLIPKGPPRPTRRCGEPPPLLLLEGIAQFNAAEYWEAHETLEGLWRNEADPVRSLYQGILLVGVGLYHLARGNYHGATTKLAAGLQRLEPYAPLCQNVDVVALREDVQRCYNAVLEAADRATPGPIDPRLIPRIRLVSSTTQIEE